ncbi:hypothetical protein [Pleionea sp. CnH1-48]|uniref:hypothetical protein n=1 Tax=Pleionea sp. CnH1-48 TaxID=2954494 RepID=UPI00209752E8|nr:hypothetical protein [Pleionea sp. CnH1-48]MCO7223035.1 hypothetical protein [Pleionea sp. CnH1-48]
MKPILYSLLLVALVFVEDVRASSLPEGWRFTGSDQQLYKVGIDQQQGKPAPSAYLFAQEGTNSEQFGTISQRFNPQKYLGKRVRLSAWVKTTNVEGWAGLWMRIDTQTFKGLTFDNMKNRPIVGSNDWKKYSIVLDVDSRATALLFGVFMSGKGKLWVDDFKFEVVDSKVPLTKANLTKPQNTNF